VVLQADNPRYPDIRVAALLTAFAAASHYNPQDGSNPSVCMALPMPTADPVLLAKATYGLFPSIHDGLNYVRGASW
jgi:DNA polymerase V